MPENPYKSPEAEGVKRRRAQPNWMVAGICYAIAFPLLLYGALLVLVGLIGGPHESPKNRIDNATLGFVCLSLAAAFLAWANRARH